LNFIFDRLLGKPKQELGISGGLVHAHTRDPMLAALPKEALEALARAYDHVLTKYAVPVLDVAQDGPQNQKESNRAIAALPVECEANTPVPKRLEQVSSCVIVRIELVSRRLTSPSFAPRW